MFCPRCQSEYRSGFSRCAACDVQLVSALAREPVPDHSDPQLVALLHSIDPYVLITARSLLEDAALPYRVIDRGLQDRLSSGSGVTDLEPVVILVRREDEAAARQLMPPWINLDSTTLNGRGDR